MTEPRDPESCRECGGTYSVARDNFGLICVNCVVRQRKCEHQWRMDSYHFGGSQRVDSWLCTACGQKTGDNPRPLVEPEPAPDRRGGVMTDGGLMDGMWDPMAEWLQANGISLSDIPMMPDVHIVPGEVTGRGDLIVIDSIYPQDADTKDYTLFLKAVPGIWTRHYPLLVEPGPELLDAYDEARRQWLADQTVEALGRAGATIVQPAAGDTIVLVTSVPITDAAMEPLRRLFMDVDVVAVENVTEIVHIKASETA